MLVLAGAGAWRGGSPLNDATIGGMPGIGPVVHCYEHDDTCAACQTASDTSPTSALPCLYPSAPVEGTHTCAPQKWWLPVGPCHTGCPR
jgi:hypothetical protein